MSYICEKGRSMVEMLGVLAVVGVLSLGALGGYSKAVGKYKTDRLIEQLSMLAMNIRSTYFDQKDYNNINNTLLINIGAIPADMYDHERTTDEIMHSWNGKITIFPSKSSNEKEMAFELYANNISKPV